MDDAGSGLCFETMDYLPSLSISTSLEPTLNSDKKKIAIKVERIEGFSYLGFYQVSPNIFWSQ
jgi:hypothetical protein